MTALGRIQRVLQVHTRYRQAGGEDRAVGAERDLLQDAGVDVQQVIFDNAELKESRSVISDMRLATDAVWSGAAAKRVATAIREHHSQVVHVHNTFAAASPSVLRAGSALGVPVVQTLHNYRAVCPAATLFRNGQVCTDCVGLPIPIPAIIHACVRGTRQQSAVAVASVTAHRAMGTYSHSVDRYVALTDFQRRLLVKAIPPDRVTVLPNFLEPDPRQGTEDRSGVLFVGRLSVEKGIDPLLKAAELEPETISVAGDGPLVERVAAAAARGRLHHFGALEHSKIMEAMKRCVAIVVPSVWYEGFPMVVLEAFATGTPVIASRIGSLVEVIEDGNTGCLVAAGDGVALAAQIRWALDHPAELASMGASARRRYVERYRGPRHLAGLLAVYESAGDRLAGS